MWCGVCGGWLDLGWVGNLDSGEEGGMESEEKKRTPNNTHTRGAYLFTESKTYSEKMNVTGCM